MIFECDKHSAAFEIRLCRGQRESGGGGEEEEDAGDGEVPDGSI